MAYLAHVDQKLDAFGEHFYESNIVDPLSDVDYSLFLQEMTESSSKAGTLDPSTPPGNEESGCTVSGTGRIKSGKNAPNLDLPTEHSSGVVDKSLDIQSPRRENLLVPPPSTLEPEAFNLFPSAQEYEKAIGVEQEKDSNVSKDARQTFDLDVSFGGVPLCIGLKAESSLSQVASPCTPNIPPSVNASPLKPPSLCDSSVGSTKTFSLEKLFDFSALPELILDKQFNENTKDRAPPPLHNLDPNRTRTQTTTPKKTPKRNLGPTPVIKTPSERKPRTYSKATPSRHCHICSRRPTEASPHVTCGNLLEGRCRKVVCEKCFRDFGLDLQAARGPNKLQWLCPHCQGNCPPRAQCFIYNRTSVRRRQNMIKHRKPKVNDNAKPVVSKSSSTFPDAAKNKKESADSCGLKRKFGLQNNQKPHKLGRRIKNNAEPAQKEKESDQSNAWVRSLDVLGSSQGLLFNGQAISEGMLALGSNEFNSPILPEVGIEMQQDKTEFNISDFYLHMTPLDGCGATSSFDINTSEGGFSILDHGDSFGNKL